MYDAEGVCGFRLGALAAVGRSYVYVKDVLGNVRSIVCAGSGEEVARYEYDAWGAVRVVSDADVSNVLGMALGSVRVGSINPIRWKGLYFDTATGLYLVDGFGGFGGSGGGRWYSPAVRQYVSACAPESALGSAGVIYGLNAHALCLTNPVGLVYDGYSVLPNADLVFDPPEMTRWQRFWDSNGGRALGAGLLVGALVFVVFVPVAAPFLKGLKTALVMSLGMTGMVLLGNGVDAGMRSAARGGCAWAGFASFVTDNWARSVVVGVVLALTVFGAKKAVVAVKGAGAKVPPPSSVQAPTHTWPTEQSRYWKKQAALHEGNIHGQESATKTYNVTSKNMDRMRKGNAPLGVDNKSVNLHHPHGREGANFFVYEEMTWTRHFKGGDYKQLHYWLFRR